MCSSYIQTIERYVADTPFDSWLPVTDLGGLTQVTLRWYGGEPVMNQVGGYEYPTSEIVDALRA